MRTRRGPRWLDLHQCDGLCWHPGDYERWARSGLSRWSYANVLPTSASRKHGKAAAILIAAATIADNATDAFCRPASRGLRRGRRQRANSLPVTRSVICLPRRRSPLIFQATSRRRPCPSIISSVKAQTSASTRSRRVAHFAAVEADRKGAHLVFRSRERTDVTHPTLFVKGADRFGTRDLTARGPDGSKRYSGIDHAQGSFDHLAAIVGFGDDAVGTALVI